MKKLKINSFSDPNFLKLGLILIGFGFLVFLASYIFDFAGAIALRGGGGLGFIICVTYLIARSKKKEK
jgi:hypothetical protein